MAYISQELQSAKSSPQEKSPPAHVETQIPTIHPHTCVNTHIYIHTYMCAYTRVYMHTYIRTYTPVNMRIYRHTYMHASTHIFMRMHTCIHTMHKHTFVLLLCEHPLRNINELHITTMALPLLSLPLLFVQSFPHQPLDH